MRFSTPKKLSYTHLTWLLLGLLLAETLVYTGFKHLFNGFTSPVFSMIMGLLFCAVALLLHLRRDEADSAVAPLPSDKRASTLALWLPFLVGALWCGFGLHQIFLAYPIDPTVSDIIPALQDIYVGRVQAGEAVYEPYSKYGYTIYPNYLPLAWLPYFFSEWLAIDYRWTAYALFVLAIFLWNIRLSKQTFSVPELALKSILPFVLLYLFMIYRETSFGHSVELTIVAFYLLLALSVFSRSSVLKAGGILLPLLSRFSFVFWLLYYGFVLLLRSRPRTFAVVGWSVLGVLLLYIIPFFDYFPDAFLAGLGYYELAAFAEWQVKPWQAAGEAPFHLGQGASFGIFFYEYLDGTVEERLQIARNAHKIFSVLAVVFMAGLHFRWRDKVQDAFFLLVALKVAMLFFYGFFYVPFFYLYLLPTLLVLPIFWEIPLGRFFKSK
jgi:hypothetical protein